MSAETKDAREPVSYGTQVPDLFRALAAPFEDHEVRCRDDRGKRMLYVTARTIMNRLDSVVGPENWWSTYVPGQNSVECRLTIRYPDPDQDGRWREITKIDSGGYAGMSDSGDDEKSGYSDALKRAGVQFGIMRYLYKDGMPWYAEAAFDYPAALASHDTNSRSNQSHSGGGGYNRPSAPSRPVGPTPSQPRQEQRQETRQDAPQAEGRSEGQAPRTGKALFAWLRQREQETDLQLVKFAIEVCKENGFPGRLVDLSDQHARAVYDEVSRKLKSVGQRDEALAN